jgi:hypothetical protein
VVVAAVPFSSGDAFITTKIHILVPLAHAVAQIKCVRRWNRFLGIYCGGRSTVVGCALLSGRDPALQDMRTGAQRVCAQGLLC